MQALTTRFADALARGSPDRELLGRIGDEDPERAARAFRRAAEAPELASRLEVWVGPLLRSARPGVGAEHLAELVARARQQGDPPPDPVAAPALPALLGSSNFLARRLLREPGLWQELRGSPPPPPEGTPPAGDWTAIRRAKYAGLQRIAGRDLLGRPFAESLEELSDLADRCLAAALDCAVTETGVAAPALLALGKLGGRELNFSSDVDLLVLFESAPEADAAARMEAVTRLVRHLKHGLEVPTGEGFAYRVDLDLRPEGRAGVLVNSVDAALSYYESYGVEWERQMLIRLRPVAGSAAGREFAEAIVPFVYRRSIDPGVMQAVREMKLRIESERLGAGRDVESDLKEGPGGIRDVEFLVQALQLFFGGREPVVRTGNVLAALAALGRLGLLPEAVAAALADAYTWLRRAEHALQLPEEQQTARFPSGPADRLGLARRMGYAQPDARDAVNRLLEDWTAVRTQVRAQFDALVLKEPR